MANRRMKMNVKFTTRFNNFECKSNAGIKFIRVNIRYVLVVI